MTDDDSDRRRYHSPDAAIAALTVQVQNVATDVIRVAGRVEGLDTKVDNLASKLDRFEGVLGVVRFLGLGGVAIAAVALLRAFGVHLG